MLHSAKSPISARFTAFDMGRRLERNRGLEDFFQESGELLRELFYQWFHIFNRRIAEADGGVEIVAVRMLYEQQCRRNGLFVRILAL